MAAESLRSTKPGDAKFKPKQVANAPATGPLKMTDLDVSTAFVDKSNQSEPIKTTGIKIRGTGAATKGTMARGPIG
jgi:hypothetical protein